ncbi:MAG: orotidine-5'-phosphate decarboxylase [Desulfatiglans sp.]|jgi:orotidine-5'-phosphate decarboxylase|nr:orotidine-5'-phosphate decarboxylase [Desulfatiglans sp.]
MNFMEKLKTRWRSSNSLLCVGLDPDIEKIPDHIRGINNPVFEFNKGVIDSTHDLVCAYKPQIAYYSAFGLEDELTLTIEHVHNYYPDIPVILDAKRGDIGATAKMYAIEAFDRYRADAVTVNPYMGGDTLAPFIDRKDKGVIILCRTSNPGAIDLQDIESGNEKIYSIIAKRASKEWNYNNNIMLVVGATYPNELAEIRAIAGDIPLLVPGIGAQGGDVEKAVKNGITNDKTGMVINSSRGIIFAGSGKNYTDAVRKAAITLRDEINLYR